MNKKYTEWQNNLTEGQLLCRDTSVHHSWEPLTAKRVKGGFERTLICKRCSTEKVQVIDSEGYVVKTKMAYVTGYLLPHDAGVHRGVEMNADMRVAGLTRATR